MERVAYVFKIKPELIEEYKKNHDQMWPEVIEAVKECGMWNYSLFCSPDGTVFAYCEAEDYEKGNEKLNKMDVTIRWEKMSEKFFIKEDKSIVIGPEIKTLKELWHMD